MGRGAGEYDRLFEWSAAPLGTPDSFGAKVRVPAVQGNLWGRLADVAAGEADVNGVTKQVLRATVSLRNYPAVLPRQLLRDLGRNETWTVESVAPGDDETVCEVYRQ